jgi:hypothetical protein
MWRLACHGGAHKPHTYTPAARGRFVLFGAHRQCRFTPRCLANQRASLRNRRVHFVSISIGTYRYMPTGSLQRMRHGSRLVTRVIDKRKSSRSYFRLAGWSLRLSYSRAPWSPVVYRRTAPDLAALPMVRDDGSLSQLTARNKASPQQGTRMQVLRRGVQAACRQVARSEGASSPGHPRPARRRRTTGLAGLGSPSCPPADARTEPAHVAVPSANPRSHRSAHS